MCSDGIDNDQNGLIDCKDSGCSQFEHCKGTTPETPKAENTEELCSDGMDNDQNGLIDCKDSGCSQFEHCQKAILCSDGMDNDDDYEVDCEDEDCNEFCDDANDPDWSCDGTFINASDIMTPGDETKATENYQNLTDFIEGNYGELQYFKDNGNEYKEGEHYHLILDGDYFIQTKKDSNGIPLERVVCLKGKEQSSGERHVLHFLNKDKYAGFYIKENGGMVVENTTFKDTRRYGGIFSATRENRKNVEVPYKHNGLADRLMFKNCTFELNSNLIRITGQWTDRNVEALTTDTLEKDASMINRITVKDCKGTMIIHMYDIGILEKFEFIHNEIKLSIPTMAVMWATSNQFELAYRVQWLGNSHAIIRNNTITGPDIPMESSTEYVGGFLIENRIVNYEGNHIENIWTRTEEEYGEDGVMPVGTKDIPPTYNAYFNSTAVYARKI